MGGRRKSLAALQQAEEPRGGAEGRGFWRGTCVFFLGEVLGGFHFSSSLVLRGFQKQRKLRR